MVGGILYFSQYNSWLIDAKREALDGSGRDHRRRDRERRARRDRPPRHSRRQPADGRGAAARQSARRRLRGPGAFNPARAGGAHRAPPHSADQAPRPRLQPGRNADRRFSDAAQARPAHQVRAAELRWLEAQDEKLLDPPQGVDDRPGAAGLPRDRQCQRHALSGGAQGPRRHDHRHAAAQREGRADRLDGGADQARRDRARRAADVDGAGRDRSDSERGARAHLDAFGHRAGGDAGHVAVPRAHRRAGQ